jgi:uncharacterized membrane-anchored protein
MKMRCALVLIIACAGFLIANGQNRKRRDRPSPTPESEAPAIPGVKWQKGPSIGPLGTVAEVHVPAGYLFAGANDTRLIMEANQNPTTGKEVGFVAPAGESWFAVFEFEDVGYIRDDEKNSLDAGALLNSIKTGTAEGNKERQRRGWPPMTIIGWEQQPRYNETTHNLEWAIRGESEGSPIINYNTRLLGRGGVVEVTLVTDPSTLSETLPKFKTMLAGFNFNQGQKYAEFRQGDKIAEYGLTGLIVGGTTAVLVKSGAFKWLWKGLIALGIAGSALVKKFMASIKNLFSRDKTGLGS